MVGTIGVYSCFSTSYSYSDEGANAMEMRAGFEAYLQKIHRRLHNEEDILTSCLPSKPNKAFTDSADRRYKNMTTTGNMEPIFIAANLHNSEKTLPNMIAQLLALADTLGHRRIFVSIYENGSNDQTKEILRRFNATLDALSIAHRIIADEAPRPEHVHRIEYMAKLRNLALEPLHSSDTQFGRVVFINDVYFCLSHLLELVFQSQIQKAHLTCGEDYDLWKGRPGFHDNWVTRDMGGNMPWKDIHWSIDYDKSLVPQKRERPFQVQCCWNGIAVFDAQVFQGDDGIRFRRSAEGECSASECSLMCNDMWRKGFGRIAMVPRVKLAHGIKVRDMIRKPSYFPVDVPFADPAREKITFLPGPEKVFCRPLNGIDTHHPDGPGDYVPV
ncbi:hypothetical protein GGH95_000711 [Coemansia sp. RSA 1836]|nr:hypothetical protein GGH95_000711 [Coemansia sp. RSA 1836]